MRETTTVQADVVLLTVIIGVLLLVGLAAVAAARWRAAGRPMLPVEDRAPHGLGRFVPVGTQVDEEFRRGVVALEQWLVVHHPRRT